jgi:hypothetical protein
VRSIVPPDERHVEFVVFLQSLGGPRCHTCQYTA